MAGNPVATWVLLGSPVDALRWCDRILWRFDDGRESGASKYGNGLLETDRDSE